MYSGGFMQNITSSELTGSLKKSRFQSNKNEGLKNVNRNPVPQGNSKVTNVSVINNSSTVNVIPNFEINILNMDQPPKEIRHKKEKIVPKPVSLYLPCEPTKDDSPIIYKTPHATESVSHFMKSARRNVDHYGKRGSRSLVLKTIGGVRQFGPALYFISNKIRQGGSAVHRFYSGIQIGDDHTKNKMAMRSRYFLHTATQTGKFVGDVTIGTVRKLVFRLIEGGTSFLFKTLSDHEPGIKNEAFRDDRYSNIQLPFNLPFPSQHPVKRIVYGILQAPFAIAGVVIQIVSGTLITLATFMFKPATIKLNKELEDWITQHGSAKDKMDYSQLEKEFDKFLKQGALINGKAPVSQETPLHHAVQLSNPNLVKLIFSKNPDLDAKNDDHQTPLGLAIYRSNKGKMEYNTDDAEQTDDVICTQQIIRDLYYKMGGTTRFYDQLNTPNPITHKPVWYELIRFDKMDYLDKLDTATQSGILKNLTGVDSQGRAPIHTAVQFGQVDIIDSLKETGHRFLDSDKTRLITDAKGLSVLNLAVYTGSIRIVKKIIGEIKKDAVKDARGKFSPEIEKELMNARLSARILVDSQMSRAIYELLTTEPSEIEAMKAEDEKQLEGAPKCTSVPDDLIYTPPPTVPFDLNNFHIPTTKKEWKSFQEAIENLDFSKKDFNPPDIHALIREALRNQQSQFIENHCSPPRINDNPDVNISDWQANSAKGEWKHINVNDQPKRNRLIVKLIKENEALAFDLCLYTKDVLFNKLGSPKTLDEWQILQFAIQKGIVDPDQNPSLSIKSLLIEAAEHCQYDFIDKLTYLLKSPSDRFELADVLMNSIPLRGLPVQSRFNAEKHLAVLDQVLSKDVPINHIATPQKIGLYEIKENDPVMPEQIITRNLESCKDFQETLLNKAAKTGDIRFVQLILSRLAVPIADKDGITPLMLACDAGDLNMVQLLKQNGSMVNSADKSGETPLMKAIRSGKTDTIPILEYLYTKGVDLNHRNLGNQNALMIAQEMDKPEIVNWLLEKGATITVPSDIQSFADDSHNCMLELMVMIRKQAMVRKADEDNPSNKSHLATDQVKSILESFSEIQLNQVLHEKTNGDANTLIMIAAECGAHEELYCIKELLDSFKNKGTEFSTLAGQRNHDNLNALLLGIKQASQHNFEDMENVFKLLIDPLTHQKQDFYTANGKSIFHLASENGDLKTFQTLERLVNPNDFVYYTSGFDDSILDLAIKNSHVNMVDYLHRHFQFDPNQINDVVKKNLKDDEIGTKLKFYQQLKSLNETSAPKGHRKNLLQAYYYMRQQDFVDPTRAIWYLCSHPLNEAAKDLINGLIYLGADPFKKDFDHKSALDNINSYKNQNPSFYAEIKSLMLNSGSLSNQQLIAIMQDNPDTHLRGIKNQVVLRGLLNLPEKNSESPLLYAILNQLNCADMLINTITESKELKKALLLSAATGQMQHVKTLVEKLKAHSDDYQNVRDHHSLSPVFWSLTQGYPEIAEYLIKEDVSINDKEFKLLKNKCDEKYLEMLKPKVITDPQDGQLLDYSPHSTLFPDHYDIEDIVMNNLTLKEFHEQLYNAIEGVFEDVKLSYSTAQIKSPNIGGLENQQAAVVGMISNIVPPSIQQAVVSSPINRTYTESMTENNAKWKTGLRRFKDKLRGVDREALINDVVNHLTFIHHFQLRNLKSKDVAIAAQYLAEIFRFGILNGSITGNKVLLTAEMIERATGCTEEESQKEIRNLQTDGYLGPLGDVSPVLLTRIARNNEYALSSNEPSIRSKPLKQIIKQLSLSDEILFHIETEPWQKRASYWNSDVVMSLINYFARVHHVPDPPIHITDKRISTAKKLLYGNMVTSAKESGYFKVMKAENKHTLSTIPTYESKQQTDRDIDKYPLYVKNKNSIFQDERLMIEPLSFIPEALCVKNILRHLKEPETLMRYFQNREFIKN